MRIRPIALLIIILAGVLLAPQTTGAQQAQVNICPSVSIALSTGTIVLSTVIIIICPVVGTIYGEQTSGSYTTSLSINNTNYTLTTGSFISTQYASPINITASAAYLNTTYTATISINVVSYSGDSVALEVEASGDLHSAFTRVSFLYVEPVRLVVTSLTYTNAIYQPVGGTQSFAAADGTTYNVLARFAYETYTPTTLNIMTIDITAGETGPGDESLVCLLFTYPTTTTSTGNGKVVFTHVYCLNPVDRQTLLIVATDDVVSPSGLSDGYYEGISHLYINNLFYAVIYPNNTLASDYEKELVVGPDVTYATYTATAWSSSLGDIIKTTLAVSPTIVDDYSIRLSLTLDVWNSFNYLLDSLSALQLAVLLYQGTVSIQGYSVIITGASLTQADGSTIAANTAPAGVLQSSLVPSADARGYTLVYGEYFYLADRPFQGVITIDVELTFAQPVFQQAQNNSSAPQNQTIFSTPLGSYLPLLFFIPLSAILYRLYGVFAIPSLTVFVVGASLSGVIPLWLGVVSGLVVVLGIYYILRGG